MTTLESLLAQILPLALGAAASPMLLAASVMILAGRVHPRLRTAVFLAGVASPFLVLGLAAVLISGPAAALVRVQFSLPPAVEIGLGVLFLLLALGTWLVPGKAGKQPAATDDPAAQPGLQWLRYYGLGLASVALNPTAIALFVLAAADIGQARLGTAWKAISFLLVGGVMLAPIEVPLILDLVTPANTQRLLKPIGEAARAHSRLIAVLVMILLGVYLLLAGVNALKPF